MAAAIGNIKIGFSALLMLLGNLCVGQLSNADLDVMDSLIASTPQIKLCKKEGKDDVRFITRTPEKYSTYRDEFIKQMATAFPSTEKSHFICDIGVEVNCEGKAGNCTFAINLRALTQADFENFKRLIALVKQLSGITFAPAVYLGENVNSKTRFRLIVKDGQPVIDWKWKP